MTLPTQTERRVAEYAELLSLEYTRAEIIAKMGITRGQAAHYWRRIIGDLGKQAR